jgi:alanyl-tRNA synthetase
MDEQLLYQYDPLRVEFEASVREQIRLPDGRLGVILERSYFYPTGGGQEADRGSLGPAQVLDVFKQGDPPVLVHVVDREVQPGTLPARIDAGRRLRHMQHHTAQHLLSQCFLRLLHLGTLSANINGYTPSTIDLPYTEISQEDLQRVEDLANSVIYEDRVVKSYFVSPQELEKVPLRRPPKVHENIRIIEIDGFDHSACGGTHTPRTGMIGVVKILRTERQNEKTRAYFIAGGQALEAFQQYQGILTSLAEELNTSFANLPEAVRRLSEQLHGAQRELQALRLERLGWEAHTLAEQALPVGARRLVTACFEGRPVTELRALAEQLKGMAGVVALLASHTGGKVSLIISCAVDTSLDARSLLQTLLAEVGGRGGGDAQIAQGGGTASLAQAQALLDQARQRLAAG